MVLVLTLFSACGGGKKGVFTPTSSGRAYEAVSYTHLDVYKRQEYGVTAGFGLPIPRTRSVLSLSAQYVRTKGTQAAFLNENTLRSCIGVTFNERWCFKRKVD